MNCKKSKIYVLRSLIFVLLFFSKSLVAQTSILNYDILRNDKVIGSLKIQKREDGNRTYLNLVSDVDVSFIISMSINITEQSIFQNNKLIYSESKRLVNENEKVNSKTSLVDGIYYSNNDGKTKILPIPVINYNLLLMYFNEPNYIKQVYSDSFQEMLKIDKIAQQHFNIILPDGGNNEYFYKDGKCIRVIVNNTFFKIEMKLKQ